MRFALMPSLSFLYGHHPSLGYPNPNPNPGSPGYWNYFKTLFIYYSLLPGSIILTSILNKAFFHDWLATGFVTILGILHLTASVKSWAACPERFLLFPLVILLSAPPPPPLHTHIHTRAHTNTNAPTRAHTTPKFCNQAAVMGWGCSYSALIIQ